MPSGWNQVVATCSRIHTIMIQLMIREGRASSWAARNGTNQARMADVMTR